MTPEEFRRQAHELVDFIADYRAGIDQQPVMSTVEPGQVAAQLPAQAPEEGDGGAGLLEDVQRIVMPGLTHWQHPSFFGFFPSNSELSSVLGDMLGSGLGVLGLSWESSPALSEIEQTVVDWTRQLFGLPEQFRGSIQDSASSSTLIALLCARERATDFALARGGLQAEEAPLIVYASRYAHSSVEKGALLAGFGRQNIHWIDTDQNHAMDPAALAAAIAQDRAAGRIPAAIVAATGTTTTTAVDPLRELGEIAARQEVWFHVDSAMAGSAMILPEYRWMWDGIEYADSVVVNAHKWLGVAFDCSLYFVRDPQHLERVMGTNPSYLRSERDDQVTNLRDWGIPLGRRFRALKLWFMLRAEGAEQLRARLRRDLENARWLAEQVSSAPGWKLAAPVNLQTVCVVHEPQGASAEQVDEHTQHWARQLNLSGRAYVSPAVLEGRWMVRVSIGALGTERSHVEQLWRDLRQVAEGN